MPEAERDTEHRVTPLELFFDLAIVAYEALRHREHRLTVRHPELAG